MSSNFITKCVLVTFFTFIMTSSGSPIETIEANDIIVCPEGAPNDVTDGIVVYPNKYECANLGGLCVQSDKCRTLVSAKGLCGSNKRSVECCFELQPQYYPCHP
ncbi:CLUMA_CG009383, isoform A [Clunio marinus]|uniref:CLUMA_CG009383, isoform A n=1 Tax=Clunio marinus TaxID=568069 RepID=A0A1J1I873_9DIPT|nr:CLUMA_CG009383, isoform A [Clunio marinus]